MFTVATSTAENLLANVTDQLGDAGTLLLLVMVAAIPLFFYVVKRIIGLVPKGK